MGVRDGDARWFRHEIDGSQVKYKRVLLAMRSPEPSSASNSSNNNNTTASSQLSPLF
jgi:hypothetical protein